MPVLRRTAQTAIFSAVLTLPAVAQTPSLTVGGVAYLHYYYLLSDTAAHGNNFDVARAYLNFNGRLDVVSSRVTADIYRVADGSLAFRLKYAFLAVAPKGSPFTFKLGQIQTTWVDWEENLWDFRMQGTVALDRNGYLSSSDFGLGIDGRWGPDRFNVQAAVLNGENYNRTPGDRHKDFTGRVSVRVLDTDDSSRVGGLRLSAYGHKGTPTGGGTRDRLVGAVSYRSRRLTTAAELATTRDAVGAAAVVRGRVMSFFGVLRIPDSPAAIIGRLDVVDPNTATANNRQTRIIAGVSYQLTTNVRLLADVDHLSYQGGVTTPALEALRSQALFQVQVSY